MLEHVYINLSQCFGNACGSKALVTGTSAAMAAALELTFPLAFIFNSLKNKQVHGRPVVQPAFGQKSSVRAFVNVESRRLAPVWVLLDCITDGAATNLKLCAHYEWLLQRISGESCRFFFAHGLCIAHQISLSCLSRYAVLGGCPRHGATTFPRRVSIVGAD